MWSETAWFSFTVPERAIQGYVYPWIRPNQGLLGGGVWVWDASAHQPWDILFWENQYNLPYPEPGDLRDIEFPTGISIRVEEPLQTYRVGYSHPELELDFTFDAIMEPHVLAGDEPKLFAAHVDQPGRVYGRMNLRGEEIPFDCFAIRDRSWGPRVEDSGLRMAYDHGSAADAAFLAFAYPDRDDSPVEMGYLLRDGEAAVLVEGRRRIERPGDWPSRVVIEATDSLGRELEAVGECVNRLSFTNIPWMFNWCSLTRWELDGRVAWGEDQDVWHLDKWRRWIRQRRAEGAGGGSE
ncbi:MAG: hypothetical protein J4G09_06405 [Proteobacteria bacterium]|nr:hypothetical protein [Pseudomonadota bacterium]